MHDCIACTVYKRQLNPPSNVRSLTFLDQVEPDCVAKLHYIIRSMICFARLVGHFTRAIKASRDGLCLDWALYSLGYMWLRWSCKLKVCIVFSTQLALGCLDLVEASQANSEAAPPVCVVREKLCGTIATPGNK